MDTTDQPPLLERLFAESAGDLARYFTRRHGVSAVVQDLVQETFLQMARGLKEGRQLKCARGYLFGIARHLSQAAWERKSREVVVPFDTVAAMADARAPVAVKDDRVDAARDTIAALAPLQREVLELRFSKASPMRRSRRPWASRWGPSAPACITPWPPYASGWKQILEPSSSLLLSL